jgi:thiol:disulfide interchange protein DsbG
MKKLITLFALSAMSTLAVAAPTPPVALQNMIKNVEGAKIQNTFKAPNNMTGWVIKVKGNETLAYTSADGKNVFIGAIFDEKGTNLSQKFAEDYGTKINYDKEFAKVEKSAFIVDGPSDAEAKATIYVFKDMNCSYCHKMYQTLEPFKAQGLQVRWIPVSILVPDAPNAPGSLAKAAYALEAKDGAKAVRDLHEAFMTRKPVAAVKTNGSSAATRDKVNKNTELMAELGFRGTPASLLKINGKVRTFAGAVSAEEISAATGIKITK